MLVCVCIESLFLISLCSDLIYAVVPTLLKHDLLPVLLKGEKKSCDFLFCISK